MTAREMRRIRPLVADALTQYGEKPRVPLEQINYSADQVLGPSLPDGPN